MRKKALLTGALISFSLISQSMFVAVSASKPQISVQRSTDANKSFRVKTDGSNSNLYSQGTESDTNWTETCLSSRYKLFPFETKGAEDFYVPVGHFWRINQIYAPGELLQSLVLDFPYNFQVTIYTDNNGIPGKMLYSRAVANQSDEIWNVDVSLDSPVTLRTGHYWLSIQVNSLGNDRSRYVFWYWQGESVPSINRAGKLNLTGFGDEYPKGWFDISSSGLCGFSEYVFSMGGIDGITKNGD